MYTWIILILLFILGSLLIWTKTKEKNKYIPFRGKNNDKINSKKEYPNNRNSKELDGRMEKVS